MSGPNSTKTRTGTWLSWLGLIVIVTILALLWAPFSRGGADPGEVRIWIEQMGPLGPLAYYVLNVIQIVVAPIPGYPVQVLGGILFGFVPGTIYSVAGMITGGVLAAWLGRRLGRPWLVKRMGTDTIRHWGEATHIDSFWTWWIILLIPLGDIPYFIAGLSNIRLGVFALAILASRGPFTALIVWTGDNMIDLPLTWLALAMAAIGLIVILGFSQAERIEKWGRTYIKKQSGEGSQSVEILD